jgi:hypothetical protein
MTRIIFILSCGLLTILTGCTLFDDESVRLSFIRVDKANLIDGSNRELSSSIRDIWVYHQNQLIGVFPLPAKIPVILDNNEISKITIKPGIKPNGSLGSSEEYAFFKPLDYDLKLSRGDTTFLTPSFQYRKDIVFDFIEDFESGNIFTEDLDGNKNTKINRSAGKGKNGGTAGEILLTKTDNVFETTHFASFSNRNNKLGKVYLELDYKTEEDFFVGLIVKKSNQTNKTQEVAIVKSDIWKRIYVDLTQKISNTSVDNYQIVISSLLNDQQRSQATVLIDNVRLVHF